MSRFLRENAYTYEGEAVIRRTCRIAVLSCSGRCATRKEKSTVGETQAFKAVEAEVAILLDSIRAGRDDKALLAFCERAAEDDVANADADRDAFAVSLHDPALNEVFDRVRRLLEAVGSI
jgi:hypothetical protein